MAERRTTSNVLHAPAYTVAEAARYLQLPASTVRSWVTDSVHGPRNKPRRYQPVIHAADRKRNLLSFTNLVELQVLSGIRKERRITLPDIRKAVRYLRTELGSDHPLADHLMLTSGEQLFIEHLGRLVNITRDGQTAMRTMLADVLRRVERDPAGVPIRLFPSSTSEPRLAQRSVVIDPATQFGRPCLAGTGIPTALIGERYKAGESVKELAEDYGRTNEEIEEAVRFELVMAA